MDRVEKSIKLYKQGYNCAQSVFCAFLDLMDIDESTALKLTQPLGNGISTLKEVCGTVNGMALVLGMLLGSDIPKDKETKRNLYNKVKELANEFQKENGSLNCGILLESKDPNIKKKSCIEYVRCCAEMIENYLAENKK